MIQCANHGFAYLAVPKTASISTRTALAPYRTGWLDVPLDKQHMSYGEYVRDYGKDLEVVAVVREPFEWIKSFHKYLADPYWNHDPSWRTDTVHLNDYIKRYIRGEFVFPEPYRFQHEYVMDGDVLVDRLFRYENIAAFEQYLSERIGTQIVLPHKNVSPPRQTEHIVPPETLEAFREYAKKDYELYGLAE